MSKQQKCDRHSGKFGILVIAIAAFLGSCESGYAQSASAPSPEIPDPRVLAAIRNEGLTDSHAAGYAQELADTIGARLMGSPNMRKAYDWSTAAMRKLGASNVHLEDIGEFGLSWRQNNAWVRLSAPDSMVFVAQAAPWSVSSNGPQEGDAVAVTIANKNDFAKYRGTLKGKIVLLGPLRKTPPPFKAFAQRWSDDDITSGKASEPQRRYYETFDSHIEDRREHAAFHVTLMDFLKSEGVLAVVLPSRDGADAGGTGDLEADNADLPAGAWTAEGRISFPMVVVAIEDFGRAWRLAAANTPVRIALDVDTQVTNDHERGFNVIGEIPGTDPKLKSQIVLLGAHLDSWASGTGATDNGTGVAACLEVLRILKAVDAKPRRTVRFVLYGGEEEGLFGSASYVHSHLRTADKSPRTLTEYAELSAAYNIDHGGGRIRGVFTGGNHDLVNIFQQWIAPLKDLGVIGVIDARYYPADQSSYTDVGLPGISVLQDPLDYDSRSHHTNMDTVERIIPEDLAQASTVLATFVSNTANRNKLLPRLTATPPKP